MICSKNGVKREGESCTLNNNCIYPKCLIMEKIPTWEEFKSAEYQLLKYGYMLDPNIDGVEFAKIHVKAALEAAAEDLLKTVANIDSPKDPKITILNAYPLSNIK